MSADSTVFVVEDDQEVRRSLCCHLSVNGLNVLPFESAEVFLEDYDESRSGCIVLDMKLPGMSGLDLIRQLNEYDYHDPVIAITGFADVSMAI